MKTLQRNLLWVIYAVVVVLAIIYRTDEHIFMSTGPYALGKYITWIIYLSFLGYSLHCSRKENFFKSLKKLYPILWARQIGIDLYMGLTIFSFVLYLHEGSILVLLVWLIPTLIYANLVTLLYIALNYDGLIAHFV